MSLLNLVANQVCPRASAVAAERLRNAAEQWKGRNQIYLRSAAAALKALGDRLLLGGDEKDRQAYWNNVLHSTVANAKKELMRDFQGATPDNQLVPPEARCLMLAEGLNAGRIDFVNTPKATMALTPYMRLLEDRVR